MPATGDAPKESNIGSIRRSKQDCGIKTMAADRAQNLQDTFLNHVRKTKTPLTIFLVNGVKLQGIVTWLEPRNLEGGADRPRSAGGRDTGRVIVIGPYLRMRRGDPEAQTDYRAM